MKLAVGLGNPGRRYQRTRHNVGFDVLAELAGRYDTSTTSQKFEAKLIELRVADQKTLLLAPQTFMNRSGRSVGQCVRFFQIPLDDLIVVCDDMNLPLGRLRLRPEGSGGGQKGLDNVISQLGSQQFSRLRVGIGRPPDGTDSTQYVLSKFRGDERERIDRAVEVAADGVEIWIREGAEASMNQINGLTEP